MVKYTVAPYYGFLGNLRQLTLWWWRMLLFHLCLRWMKPPNPFEYTILLLATEAFKRGDIITMNYRYKYKVIRKHEYDWRDKYKPSL